MRIVFAYILPFLLPAIVFVTWTWLRARWIERHGGEVPPIEKGAWFWVILSGLLLVLVTLFAMAILQAGGEPGDVYIPPRVIDGEVVPYEYRR